MVSAGNDSLEDTIWGFCNVLMTWNTLLSIAAAWVAYKILQIAYNLSPLHPLSHIPGPRLAAASYLPELYWDVICGGRYTRQIRDIHRNYGPIVRINPNEVHCDDVDFSDEIYAVGGRKRDKPTRQVDGLVLIHTGFGTVDHDLHRLRRAPLAKFFSRSMIARLEPEIQALAQTLCDKLLAQSGKEAFDLTVAYSCFTTDAISGYAFGQSLGYLTREGWYPNFRNPTIAALKPVYVLRFLPFLKHLASSAAWVVDYLPEDVGLVVRNLQIDLPKKIDAMKADLNAGKVPERPTIFASMLESSLPEREKGTSRLAKEAFAVLSAGTETTSWALAVITYHLLEKPHLLEKLRRELLEAGAGKESRQLPAWTELEKLPFLGAVIQEGLRLSYGVATRTARVAPGETLLYRGEWNKKPIEYTIPRGYAIGMSAAIMHHDEKVFPDSHAFIPERWLDSQNQRRKEVERGLFSFSRGSRQCIAVNLAYCELYLGLAALALRVLPRMRLFKTTEEDVTWDYDILVPMTKKSSKGVRVTID
ncbi:Cyrochrome P450 monooxygenase [Apiospora hydei]|uniref:Cyrochrome P450 monooxygenase n=1 Tax=Apiospora hydei TaxID=1337664 RepID=A0ABR1X428_9PEZI